MRLAVLVLAILCCAVPARAKRIHVGPVCKCANNVVLPRSGDTDVPTNARLWRLPALDDPDEPLDLAPNTDYAKLGAAFTTGHEEDHTAPNQPRVTEVHVWTADGDERTRGQVSELWLMSMFDLDTAVVRLTLTDAFGSVRYYTTPDEAFICNPGFSLLRGPLRIEVTAIDLAGNESPPDVYMTRAADVAYRDVCPAPYTRAPDGGLGLAILPVVMIIPAFVIVLGILSRRRALECLGASVEPFAIASVDDLARSVRNRAMLVLTTVATATSLAMNSHDLRTATLVASPLIAWATGLSIMRLWSAHRALQLIAHDDAIAEVRCDQVDIIARGQHAVLRAAPWLVQRAKQSGVPRATL